MNYHEDFRRTVAFRGSSDRGFGIVFSLFFFFVALWPLLAKKPVREWALVAGGIFLILTLLRPALLHGLNRLWTRFGVLLGKLTTPLVMAAIYYAVITPAGLLFRLCGRDLVRLRRDPAEPTYWIERRPAGPAPESMADQF